MKKFKIYSNHIPIDMFDKEVVVLVTNSKGFLQDDIEKVLLEDMGMREDIGKEFAKELREILQEEDFLSPGLTVVITTKQGYKDVFCIFDGNSPKDIPKPVVIHEMFHAMRSICKTSGVDDEETMAYMLEYLCEEFFRIADNFGKKDKKS